MDRSSRIIMSGFFIVALSLLIVTAAQSRGNPFSKQTAQHDTILNAIGDLQDSVDALGDLQPPCGPNTVGQRFVVSQDGLTACDNTTGFIWEQTPDNSLLGRVAAIARCAGKQVGGLDGWSLPTLKQWFSLIDYSQPGPLPRSGDLRALPLGHPFPIGQSPPENNVETFYWSSTPFTETPTTKAWSVRLDDGRSQFESKADELFVWCVRDGQS